MKAIAIGLLAAAGIALSAPANAHIWVDGRGDRKSTRLNSSH